MLLEHFIFIHRQVDTHDYSALKHRVKYVYVLKIMDTATREVSYVGLSHILDARRRPVPQSEEHELVKLDHSDQPPSRLLRKYGASEMVVVWFVMFMHWPTLRHTCTCVSRETFMSEKTLLTIVTHRVSQRTGHLG